MLKYVMVGHTQYRIILSNTSYIIECRKGNARYQVTIDQQNNTTCSAYDILLDHNGELTPTYIDFNENIQNFITALNIAKAELNLEGFFVEIPFSSSDTELSGAEGMSEIDEGTN